jgi:hypothetical protein
VPRAVKSNSAKAVEPPWGKLSTNNQLSPVKVFPQYACFCLQTGVMMLFVSRRMTVDLFDDWFSTRQKNL